MRAPERSWQFALHDTPVGWRVIERPDLAHILCPPVPRVQRHASGGPASIWQTLAHFKIDRIKGQAPSAPVIRGSAEIAEPAGSQIEEGPSNIVASVEFLCSAIKLRPAAFQQNTGQPGPLEFTSKRDTSGSCTDDANLGGDVRAAWDVPSIDEHAAFPVNNSINQIIVVTAAEYRTASITIGETSRALGAARASAREAHSRLVSIGTDGISVNRKTFGESHTMHGCKLASSAILTR